MKSGRGLVAFSASRKAVEGAAEALRIELASSGIDVVLLKPLPISPVVLYGPPTLKKYIYNFYWNKIKINTGFSRDK